MNSNTNQTISKKSNPLLFKIGNQTTNGAQKNNPTPTNSVHPPQNIQIQQYQNQRPPTTQTQRNDFHPIFSNQPTDRNVVQTKPSMPDGNRGFQSQLSSRSLTQQPNQNGLTQTTNDKKTSIIQGSRLTSRTEWNDEANNIFNYSYNPLPRTQLNLGPNVWENYKLLASEIRKKETKLNEVNSLISKMKISSDQNEVRRLHNEIGAKKNTLNKLKADIQGAERYKMEMLTKKGEIQLQINEQNNNLIRMTSLEKSPEQLNAELSSVKQEYQQIQSEKMKLEYEMKLQLDKENRETMEKKVLTIIMEAARNSSDLKVKELYQKLVVAYPVI